MRIDTLSIDRLASHLRLPSRNITATGTTVLQPDDAIVFVNTANGVVTTRLPAATLSRGKLVIIAKVTVDANAVTITSAGGNVNGVASATLIGGAFSARICYCDGTDWWAFLSAT